MNEFAPTDTPTLDRSDVHPTAKPKRSSGFSLYSRTWYDLVRLRPVIRTRNPCDSPVLTEPSQPVRVTAGSVCVAVTGDVK